VISLDGTLFIQMINFLILLWILNRFLYKPVLNILEQRRGRIRDSQQRVAELGRQAAQQWETYQRKLQEAKIEANTEKEKIKGEGLDTERKMLEEIRAEASQELEASRRKLEEESTKALDYLRSQADDIAVQIAEKILGRSVQ
jgi:F-type H+-transporting ATPase subunit b